MGPKKEVVKKKEILKKEVKKTESKQVSKLSHGSIQVESFETVPKREAKKSDARTRSISKISHISLQLDSFDLDYTLNGNFFLDFKFLCKEADMCVIPPVEIRPCWPKPSATALLIGQDKIRDIKNSKLLKGRGKMEDIRALDDDKDDATYMTFITRRTFSALRPKVHVELEDVDKPDSVTKIYIHGWKIDKTMLEILKKTWPFLEKLCCLHFWRTGLTENLIESLANTLSYFHNITTLVLDGNPNKEENFHFFLGVYGRIAHLSLRHCEISDLGAKNLGLSLGTMTKANTTLVTLDLSGNFITSTGAISLANGLKRNRTLLSLALANNKIGDEGAINIAHVLSQYPLNAEELIYRRGMNLTIETGKILSSNLIDKTIKKINRSKLQLTPRQSKTKAHQQQKQKEKIIKPPAKKTLSREKFSFSEPSGTIPDISTEPILEAAESRDGFLWVKGNFYLINLNLSKNLIDVKGMEAIRNALEFQVNEQQKIKVVLQPVNIGLRRLIVTKNLVPNDNSDFMAVNDLMKIREQMKESEVLN